MRRAILGLTAALGVVAWAVARPRETPAPTDPADDFHTAAAAEHRFHTSAQTHWRDVALNR
jgi:hypothetical protein